MRWLVIAWMVTSFLFQCGNSYTSVNGGSYNSFVKQVGYCKQQSFDTVSRTSSQTPLMFQTGKVMFGVGLSHVQFQKSIVSCGQCLWISSIDRFYQFNEELTDWDYKNKVTGNITVMVFDECTDAICESGFLDFDIYNERQPVAFGNPTDLMWEFIPCPVSPNDTISFLFCLGYNTCQFQNEEGRSVLDLYDDAVKDNWVTLYPRNFRIPIVSVHLQGQPLEDNQSWVWKASTGLQDDSWLLEWTNHDGSQQSWIVNWPHYFEQTSTEGYRGGFILETELQN